MGFLYITDNTLVLRVSSVLFDDRVETEISVCLETQKLLSQGPLCGKLGMEIYILKITEF